MTDPIEDYRAMANMLSVLQARTKAFKANGVPHDAALYDAICYLLMREMLKMKKEQVGKPAPPRGPVTVTMWSAPAGMEELGPLGPPIVMKIPKKEDKQ